MSAPLAMLIDRNALTSEQIILTKGTSHGEFDVTHNCIGGVRPMGMWQPYSLLCCDAATPLLRRWPLPEKVPRPAAAAATASVATAAS